MVPPCGMGRGGPASSSAARSDAKEVVRAASKRRWHTGVSSCQGYLIMPVNAISAKTPYISGVIAVVLGSLRNFKRGWGCVNEFSN